MNFGPQETARFLQDLARSFGNPGHAQMRLYVPYIDLQTADAATRQLGIPVQIGAQNVHFEKSGAFTGEISAAMLKEIGISSTLVGHSERRQHFGETNETAMKRTASAIEQGLELLTCIGETLEERNLGQTRQVLETHLRPVCLNAFGENLHLAYEPVWAIGTGVTATPEQAQEAHLFIRKLLEQKLGTQRAEKTKILYGGSVTPANFANLLLCPDIDGGLVGGASLKPDTWLQLWNLAREV